jgi:hypothetical protein
MVAAGAVPITWMAVLSEWQRDWAREETAASLSEVMRDHGGASGVAFAWELQLQATGAGSACAPVSPREKDQARTRARPRLSGALSRL